MPVHGLLGSFDGILHAESKCTNKKLNFSNIYIEKTNRMNGHPFDFFSTFCLHMTPAWKGLQTFPMTVSFQLSSLITAEQCNL